MNLKNATIAIFLLLLFLISVSTANAGTCKKGVETANSCNTTIECLEGYICETGQTTSGTVSLTNPLTGKTTFTESTDGIPTLLGKIIKNVLGVIGSLALVMIIYGGVIWMLSGGSQERVTKGKNILIWAIVGIIIIFTAYALVNFILSTAVSTQ